MLRTPAMLHPFAPRPAAGASRAFALQCAHVWALANVRKTGYAGISVFASACSLFNHTIRLFVQDKAPMLKSDKISGYSRLEIRGEKGDGVTKNRFLSPFQHARTPGRQRRQQCFAPRNGLFQRLYTSSARPVETCCHPCRPLSVAAVTLRKIFR